ncbi:MAG: hypothetical protein ACT4NK_00410 [Limnobacter sp.]|uniref:hypothetical protein n=1 Tax=Limnobacter sp. TaxID=2003368 RepID=UPI0040381A69
MWLMLLALPVQGMAQASMFACHLNGNSSSAGQAIDHSTMSHGAMNHDGMDHSMHNMDAQADPDSSKKLMKSLHGCCNCAPTCAVVLLPVAQASFTAILQDATHPVSVAQLPHSADTRRIDRPPKTLAI